MASVDYHSPQASASTALFRFVAVMVLFLSITACGLEVLAGLNTLEHPDPNAPVAVPTVFIPAILSLIAGIALATLLEGVARLVGAQPAEPVDLTASQVNLMMTIAELQNTLPGLIGEAVHQSVSQVQPSSEAAEPGTADPNLQQSLDRMIKLIEEMKELSMLDDTQRKNRRQQVQLRRKSSRIEEVAILIQQGNWAQADALLHLLDSLHPDDADVLACRNQLDNARILNQANDWESLAQKTNDQLALSQYAEAADAVNQFLERYPTHSEAQALGQRIRHEHRLFIETTSGRLYDEIKTAVENRKWRAALDGIQQFLDRYPDNPRAEKIRKQIRTIQKNAEIEERHEQEDRIKELINNQQFREAADLSEDLLARFPDSPQAAYLTDLLPKLRERSNETQDIVT